MKNERTGLLATQDDVSTEKKKKKNTLASLFEDPGNGAAFRPESSERSFAVPTKGFIHSSIQQHTPSSCTTTDISGTFIGSLVFCIYHVVFCLAQAAAIARPHSNNHHNSTGILAKMAALGTITAGTSFIFFLGNDIPAIYPGQTDLFLKTKEPIIVPETSEHLEGTASSWTRSELPPSGRENDRSISLS